MAVSDKDKARLRIIRFLSRGAAHASYVPGGRNVLLDGAERGTVSVCAEVLRAATKDGLVEKRAGKLVLSGDCRQPWIRFRTNIASGRKSVSRCQTAQRR